MQEELPVECPKCGEHNTEENHCNCADYSAEPTRPIDVASDKLDAELDKIPLYAMERDGEDSLVCTCNPTRGESCPICEYTEMQQEPYRQPIFGPAGVTEEPSDMPGTCGCGPKETCPLCKDEKLAAGISPKHDAGKLEYSLVPPVAMKAMAEVLTFGAQKYAPNSWQGVENGEKRYLDALIRHLEDYRSGITYDEDSGLPHLSHAITNLGFLCHFEKERLNAIS